MYDSLRESLKRDEGLRFRLYKCPAGKLTIGYGRNIEDRGITEDEAELMLSTDIDLAIRDCVIWIGDPATWQFLDEVRQGVLIQMMFNMGLPVLRQFKQFRKALLAEDYSLAAVEMLDSKWAKQVGDRAKRLAKEMRTGVSCGKC